MTTMPTDSRDDDLTPLLSEPFARVWAAPEPATRGRMDERLSQRLQQSVDAERAMVTVRRRRVAAQAVAEGVEQRPLYHAPLDRPLRPGEPRMAHLIELRAGAELALAAGGAREFLVLAGGVEIAGESLGLRDYLLLPAGSAVRLVSSSGAQVFVRESDAQAERTLVRDLDAGWPEFAPGIRRRVLWSGGGQAALLYHADPGASVPGHCHGHDEECLMVQGELFLDDVLLQPGDYQLAPAGTGHRITETDTGVIIYAHGDLDLQFV